MARPQCFAYDADTKLRCTRPGGHPGPHRVTKDFTDDTTWVPVLTSADLLDLPPTPAEPLALVPDDDDAGVCVACGHADDHLTVEEAGDAAGCQAAECMCLTAVRV